MLLKKAFSNPVDAVTSLKNVPEDDLLRIIGVYCAPELRSALADLLADKNHLDRSLIAVAMAHSFHSGYSTSISDVTSDPPRNLHMEFQHEIQQRTANAGGAPGTASAGSPNRN